MSCRSDSSCSVVNLLNRGSNTSGCSSTLARATGSVPEASHSHQRRGLVSTARHASASSGTTPTATTWNASDLHWSRNHAANVWVENPKRCSSAKS